jgi:hypothetical protein
VRGAGFGGDFFGFVSAVVKHGSAKIVNATTTVVSVRRIMEYSARRIGNRAGRNGRGAMKSTTAAWKA